MKKTLALNLFMSAASAVLGVPEALAQRLTIDSTTSGPYTKVIYGQIINHSVVLFEKDYPLVRIDVSGLPAPVARPSEESEPVTTIRPSDSALLPARFQLSPAELSQCQKSPRYAGFRGLVKALSQKIGAISIAAGDDASTCAEAISSDLKVVVPLAKIETQSGFDEGIQVSLGVSGSQKIAPPLAGTNPNTSPDSAMSFAERIKFAKVVIDDKNIPVAENGWFAAEMETSEAVEIEIAMTGYKTWNERIRPVMLSAEPAIVGNSKYYHQRLAVFNRPTTKITIIAVPILDQKTTLDGGLGGGVGYGREIPGEQRGQRYMSTVGIEKRLIYKDIGARATLLYSKASNIVPQTITTKALIFTEASTFENTLSARIGFGGEAFLAQIKPTKNATKLKTSNSIFIPQQVMAPLLSLGLHGLIMERLVISPTLYYTPLYITSYGFYPSFSPAIEVGFKISKNWVVTAQTGSEVHRFPNPAGDTKLQLDYTMLTVKRGLF